MRKQGLPTALGWTKIGRRFLEAVQVSK